MTMRSRKLLYVLGMFISLFLLPNVNFSQCGNSSDIPDYTDLISTQTVSIIPEISGMTFNDATGELVAVSDEGAWAKRHSSGVWSGFGFNNYGGSHCVSSQFSDIEAITYMTSYTPTLHRYAIADERDRSIVFVDVSNSQTSISHPSVGYLKFSGLSCGGNNGIEGIAYDQNSNKMYFGTEYSDQKIYSFTVPAAITGQTVSVQTVVNLRNVPGLSTYSTHGIDVMANGNIVALVTKPGNGDNGAFERMIVEFDACGTMLGQVDLEPTIANSAELEGIAVVGNDIYVIGEFGVMYQLAKQVTTGTITVASPGTLGSYQSGSQVQVNWVSSNVTGNVKIDLFNGGNFVSTLNSNTNNDGSHSVTLPNIGSTGSGYTVVVSSLNDPSVLGSSGDFTIDVPSGTLDVTSPGSGDTHLVGSPATITWTSSNVPGNVKLELFKSSSLVAVLSANTANDGSQAILVPSVQDGTDYRIKVSSINNSNTDDFGDFFTITSPSVTVTAPSSGDVFASGSNTTVSWTSTTSGNMKIDLYKGTTLVANLLNSTSDDGSQAVTLPNINTTASNYKIRVTNISSGINDTSQNFTIAAAQQFQITSPSAGAVIGSGTTTQVVWSSDYTGTVRIELYKGGVFQEILVVSTTDDGVQSITLPANISSTASDYSLKLINKEDSSIFDFSDNFTITVADFISVTNPDSSDSFTPGDPISVQWTTNMGGNVRIDLYENGALIANLASSTPNDQSQTLTIPSGINGGPDCIIRVTSLQDPNVSDDSDMFLIDPVIAGANKPDLVVVNPGSANQSGSVFSVSGISVQNQGQVAAGNYSIGAYLSTDPNITLGDFRIGTIGTPSGTGVGGLETNSFSADLSQLGLADGNYYFGVIADEFDDIDELDPANNFGIITSVTANISTAVAPSNCVSISSGSYSESFENGLGSWVQATNDDMNWTDQTGSTPSYLTGPSSAKDGSHYLYTESSNGNRLKSAKLTSPCFDLSGTQNPSFTFQCHMFGSTMGSLTINVIDQATNQKAQLFTQSGDQGDQWILATANLSSFIGKSIKIEIDGLTGFSYRSDIAIDEVKVFDGVAGCAQAGTPCNDGDNCTTGETYDNNCNCTGGVYTDNDNDGICAGDDSDDNDACEPVAGPSCGSCASTVNGAFLDGFNSNFLYWTQASNDLNQWIRKSGSTPSSKTGPTSAIEGSHYVYIEASYGGYPFKNAVMNSACIDLSTLSTPKLGFSYHMYGSSMGSLRVSVINIATGAETEVFAKAGNQGNSWQAAQVDLSAFQNQTIQIKIEGETGFGFRSDIAIDQVEVSNTAGNFTNSAETRNFVELSSADIDIQEEEIMDFAAYPNPVRDLLTVEFESAIVGNANLLMYNTNGQLVLEQEVNLRKGALKTDVNVTGLGSGTYHLSLISNETRINQKVLVVK